MITRFSLFVLLVTIGCGPSAPAPPAAIPKDLIRVVPDPVDADAPEEFSTTESGLKYRIRRKSDGKKPVMNDKILLHYRGTLDSGEIFDSTYGKFGMAKIFQLKPDEFIKGWIEGLQLVGVGGMIELSIPPDLAYGETGRSGIPPNSTIHFIIELLEIK